MRMLMLVLAVLCGILGFCHLMEVVFGILLMNHIVSFLSLSIYCCRD
jgi:hypothetical protein